MVVKFVQLQKAAEPILVTLLGSVMFVKFAHSSKADEPILVTLLGIVMLEPL